MIPVRGFEGKRVAVFGLARSGLTAARALMAGGAEVIVWDDNAEARFKATADGLTVEDFGIADWSTLTALVLSPGVPLTHPAPHWTVNMARAAGVEIIGDVELFARTVNAAPPHKRPKVVAITGTNGKSTTTALLGWICEQAGKDVRVGGNIGAGVLGLEDTHGGAVYVLELSSYQLDLTHSLKADVSVLLNITPDHLDRHGGMEGYVAAKRRIFLNQGKGDTAIIGADDEYSQRICTEVIAANGRTVWPISSGRALGRGVYCLSGILYDATAERVQEVADLHKATALPGKHNGQNAAAAYAAARAIGISAVDAAAALQSFPGLAHRMEDVGKIGRVRFINDSKATNADAARQAMSSIQRFRWIAGGVAKSGGIDSLADLFGRADGVYLIGQAAEDFAHTLRSHPSVRMCGDVEHAAAAALEDALRSGREETVLFSPACASFDQFADFEERGEAFRSAVKRLATAASEPLARRA